VDFRFAVEVEAALVAQLQDPAARTALPKLLRERSCFTRRNAAWRQAEQDGSLGFVGRENIDAAQQGGGERLRGRGIEDGLRAFFARYFERRGHRIERRFQLKQSESRAAENRAHAFYVRCGERLVRARRHDDRILTRPLHPDQRDAGRLRARAVNGAGIHARGCKAGFQVIPEKIVAGAAGHPHHARITAQPARGASLICALATGEHLKIAAQNGLAGRGQAVHRNHEIHVQAANDGQNRTTLGHRVKSIPSFFSSSA
jgi:hypothetical protein